MTLQSLSVEFVGLEPLPAEGHAHWPGTRNRVLLLPWHEGSPSRPDVTLVASWGDSVYGLISRINRARSETVFLVGGSHLFIGLPRLPYPVSPKALLVLWAAFGTPASLSALAPPKDRPRPAGGSRQPLPTTIPSLLV